MMIYDNILKCKKCQNLLSKNMYDFIIVSEDIFNLLTIPIIKIIYITYLY